MESPCSRRALLGSLAAVGGASLLAGRSAAARHPARRYHYCLNAHEVNGSPELLTRIGEAGVTDIWLAAYFYGWWFSTPEEIAATSRALEDRGFTPHVINVPLGHPGDSLGAREGAAVPLSPPQHWRVARRPDASIYSGTSLHTPAVEENCAAVRALEAAGARDVFLDDDFRLATSPGTIGGCFCDDCRREFLEPRGWGQAEWEGLLQAVGARTPCRELSDWLDFWCDRLTGMFRAMEAAARGVRLGPMVMYLGAEKAGIRLADYRDRPFRVGELMFDDSSFGSVKGKTDELFSALFHRRYAAPELAFSETTAYPADRLSAANMAAKLSVSLLADVRNTMYMSGLTPFPESHWETLGPAMAESARLHERTAGHRARGPLKHYWGEAARTVGDDNPFSLFLALGLPFEVVDTWPSEGWAFLSDADARGAPEPALEGGATLLAREGRGLERTGLRATGEDLTALFALKREVVASLTGVPYIAEETPVVLAWYPSARCALAWNLTEAPCRVTLVRDGVTLATLDLPALGVRLAEVP